MPVEVFQPPANNNERIDPMYNTPVMQGNTRNIDWIPDESGINPQFAQCFRAFDSYMEAAFENVKLDVVQWDHYDIDDHDDDDDEP